jgi:hypothetical protein
MDAIEGRIPPAHDDMDEDSKGCWLLASSDMMRSTTYKSKACLLK